jgi:hypothetical protein
MFITLAASIALLAWATIEGRWRRETRIAEVVINAILGGVLIWLLRAGPVFTADATDDIMKLGMSVAAIGCLIVAGLGAHTLWPPGPAKVSQS